VARVVNRVLISPQPDFRFSEPDEYVPELSNIERFKNGMTRHCFTPSAASVITISAPEIPLSGSLLMLLIALSIYLGFVWTRSLDQGAGIHDRRTFLLRM
jgi:hypothetical protein